MRNPKLVHILDFHGLLFGDIRKINAKSLLKSDKNNRFPANSVSKSTNFGRLEEHQHVQIPIGISIGIPIGTKMS